jgi:PRTRC genetic system protein C
MVIQETVRVFKHGSVTLPDPNPAMSAEEVMQFYALQYPELTNATFSSSTNDNYELVYEFRTNIGTKG